MREFNARHPYLELWLVMMLASTNYAAQQSAAPVHNRRGRYHSRYPNLQVDLGTVDV